MKEIWHKFSEEGPEFHQCDYDKEAHISDRVFLTYEDKDFGCTGNFYRYNSEEGRFSYTFQSNVSGDIDLLEEELEDCFWCYIRDLDLGLK